MFCMRGGVASAATNNVSCHYISCVFFAVYRFCTVHVYAAWGFSCFVTIVVISMKFFNKRASPSFLHCNTVYTKWYLRIYFCSGCRKKNYEDACNVQHCTLLLATSCQLCTMKYFVSCPSGIKTENIRACMRLHILFSGSYSTQPLWITRKCGILNLIFIRLRRTKFDEIYNYIMRDLWVARGKKFKKF